MAERAMHVTGGRPNFRRLRPVIKALQDHGVEQKFVHTGQHNDESMSDLFFRQLNLPEPDIDLGVESGSHAAQTAGIMTGLEEILDKHRYRPHSLRSAIAVKTPLVLEMGAGSCC